MWLNALIEYILIMTSMFNYIVFVVYTFFLSTATIHIECLWIDLKLYSGVYSKLELPFI